MELLAEHMSANHTASLARPMMRFVSSALLLGSVALQAVLGRSVDSFIDAQSPVALQPLLCNIGPDGCNVKSAAPGVVVASPSTQNPDCGFLLSPLCPDQADRYQISTPGLGTAPWSSSPSSTGLSASMMPACSVALSSSSQLRPSSNV